MDGENANRDNLNEDDQGDLRHPDDAIKRIVGHEVSALNRHPGTYTLSGSFVFVPLVGKPSQPAGMPISGDSPIEALELMPRTYNCLTRAGLWRVSDVASLSDEQLLGIRNFTAECLDDLRERLSVSFT